MLNLPYGPNLTSLHDYWRNHSFGPQNQSQVCYSDTAQPNAAHCVPCPHFPSFPPRLTLPGCYSLMSTELSICPPSSLFECRFVCKPSFWPLLNFATHFYIFPRLTSPIPCLNFLHSNDYFLIGYRVITFIVFDCLECRLLEGKEYWLFCSLIHVPYSVPDTLMKRLLILYRSISQFWKDTQENDDKASLWIRTGFLGNKWAIYVFSNFEFYAMSCI